MPSHRLGCLLLFCIFLFGCVPAATVPLHSLKYQKTDIGKEKNLLVLLRGLGASNKIFENKGLIQEVRQRGLPFDIIVPDLHFGYYQAETVVERLHKDIILPARQQGYKNIWLTGFSMGGLGSLSYLRAYPDQVDGVILISPFIGRSGIISEIKNTGGVHEWKNTTEDVSDWQRHLWSWIKQFSIHQEDYPPIYLGFGENDSTSGDGPALLVDVLPSDRSLSVPGGHNDKIFITLFYKHLDRLDGLLMDQE